MKKPLYNLQIFLIIGNYNVNMCDGGAAHSQHRYRREMALQINRGKPVHALPRKRHDVLAKPNVHWEATIRLSTVTVNMMVTSHSYRNVASVQFNESCYRNEFGLSVLIRRKL